MSPISRTLEALRKSNYVADVVERFIPCKKDDEVRDRALAGFRKDLFGCIDVVAARRGEPGILGIQATTIDHVPTRLAKARGQAELAVWLAAGGRFEVWGWYLQAGRWKVKRVQVQSVDVRPQIVQAPKRRRKRINQPSLF